MGGFGGKKGWVLVKPLAESFPPTVLQPSGSGEGDLCRLPEDCVPHGAVGGRQAHFPQLLLLLQALPHQAEVRPCPALPSPCPLIFQTRPNLTTVVLLLQPGQLRGTARGILLQTPFSAAV